MPPKLMTLELISFKQQVRPIAKKQIFREKRDKVAARAGQSTFLILHIIVITKKAIMLVIVLSQKTSCNLNLYVKESS